MADNLLVTPGSGATVATDEVGGAHYQRVKIQIGADGERADVDGGQQTMANSVPTVLASDHSAIIIGGSAADDAAAAGNPVRLGAIYQATPDEVDDGDIGTPRISKRRGLITSNDYSVLVLSSSTPVPTGSDITDDTAGAIVAGDLAIRDNIGRWFMAPFALAGWKHIAFTISVTAFDQAGTIIIAGTTAAGNIASPYFAQFTLPASTTFNFTIADSGAVGQGGTAGGATAASTAHYSIPAMNSIARGAIGFRIGFSVAPTAGSFTLTVERST